MKQSVLVTGSDGMVGSRFVELFEKKELLYLPLVEEFDLTDKGSILEAFKNYNIKTVVNFAAYTNVDEAEKQRGNKNALCWQVNFEGVKNLVDVVGKNKTRLIHISTDMVYSGSEETPGPYSENVKPEEDLNKLTWYGFTKAEADRHVINILGKKAAIIRIIYPVRAKFDEKSDYLRKPLELYDLGKLYPLIKDQQISISLIDEIAEALEKIIDQNLSDVHHISSNDIGTPLEIISYMLNKVRGVSMEDLKSISLNELLVKTEQPVFRYPKMGGLESVQTQKRLKMRFRTWKKIIDELIKQGIET